MERTSPERARCCCGGGKSCESCAAVQIPIPSPPPKNSLSFTWAMGNGQDGMGGRLFEPKEREREQSLHNDRVISSHRARARARGAVSGMSMRGGALCFRARARALLRESLLTPFLLPSFLPLQLLLPGARAGPMLPSSHTKAVWTQSCVRRHLRLPTTEIAHSATQCARTLLPRFLPPSLPPSPLPSLSASTAATATR